MAASTSSNFPLKVHAILERGYKCICWCGPNCFRLVDKRGLVEEVLPKFFKHEKLSSFTRQLNIYGFHKIREGPLKGAYTHEDFMRGDLERVSSILRTKRSGPREVMKARESRNASVIYSSMMVNKEKGINYSSDTSSSSEASVSSWGSFADYSSDTSTSAPVEAHNKRKRTVLNEQTNLSVFPLASDEGRSIDRNGPNKKVKVQHKSDVSSQTLGVDHGEPVSSPRDDLNNASLNISRVPVSTVGYPYFPSRQEYLAAVAPVEIAPVFENVDEAILNSICSLEGIDDFDFAVDVNAEDCLLEAF